MFTTLPQNTLLDLQPWVGQRTSTFTFNLLNGVTGEQLGQVNPLRGSRLSHDTTRIIKRQLNLNLGVVDTALISPLTDRIEVSMKLGDGSVWPLGRYMFTDESKTRFTSGKLGNLTLNDEMFLVDQELTVGFDATNKLVTQCYLELLADLPIAFTVEPSTFLMSQSWTLAAHRGQILDALALAGDYFSPWFGNDKKLHLIRTFNPADKIPQFDWDSGNQVMRQGIIETSAILTAPNRFLVVSNTNAQNGPIAAVATVPPTAPNSFANRGFYITKEETLQLTTQAQAESVATGLANRLTVFETAQLNTALDPRHDSYDVIAWQGSLWLELAWSMDFSAGGQMTHTIRKAYAP